MGARSAWSPLSWGGGEGEEGKRLGRDDVTGFGRETAVGRRERVSYRNKDVVER